MHSKVKKFLCPRCSESPHEYRKSGICKKCLKEIEKKYKRGKQVIPIGEMEQIELEEYYGENKRNLFE